MELNLSNDYLTLAVDTRGAEVTSLKTRSGKELIWTGDPKYWNRHSPLLFPCVGGNWDGLIHVSGHAYKLPKHGFVQDAAFEAVDTGSETSLTLRLSDSEETRAMYPFAFRLTVRYTLCERTLRVEWDVENASREPMPFMIGGHPALLLPQFDAASAVHGYLRFPEVDELRSTPTQPNGYTHPERVERFQLADHTLALMNDTFRCDTILDTTGRTHEVELLDTRRTPVLSVKFQSPVLALWAPCNGTSPFVCVEPWFGLCDTEGYDGEFADRPFVQRVAPNETWTGGYELTVSDEA